MAGKYKGIVKTKLDGFNQIDYLTGKSEKSNRDTFFYYQGATPLGRALQELEVLLHHDGLDRPSRHLMPPVTYHWTQVQNIMRDPFENNVGAEQKGAFSVAGALASPEHGVSL